ncbi:hypothetical protein HYFRA_00004935 [Hymenoscyphus fraxineus]|uniref:Uncharacterized protein n=1 Tax=Hymenoscyphus fraxineus TaxID=746836 RepID=A0A9N9PEM2_9HELO|nr:hypothetical protein HYFRA_00004935 [Hymenoscyphus fraxineus]
MFLCQLTTSIKEVEARTLSEAAEILIQREKSHCGDQCDNVASNDIDPNAWWVAAAPQRREEAPKSVDFATRWWKGTQSAQRV